MGVATIAAMVFLSAVADDLRLGRMLIAVKKRRQAQQRDRARREAEARRRDMPPTIATPISGLDGNGFDEV